MSKRESIARYGLIINKLRKGPATFDEIDDYLSLQSEIDGYDYNISKRTFQRDLRDIESIYGVEVTFDFSQKVYRIEKDDQEEISERVLEAFDTINALNTVDRIANYLYFEKRRPKGTENFLGLLHAIRNRQIIKFTYRKYWDDDISERTVEPYALKEFKNRWYVISKDLKDEKLKSFGLDRLRNLTILKRKYKPVKFDENAHYRHCFGIIAPNAKAPSEVVLSFTKLQGKYIKSMPLHESQQVIVDSKDEFCIKLKVFITEDLIMEILSFGDRVKVMQPKVLADQVKLSFKTAMKNYN